MLSRAIRIWFSVLFLFGLAQGMLPAESPQLTASCLPFAFRLAGVRQGRGTHFQPRFKFKIMQYNLYFGVCRFCKEAEKNHMSDGKCVTRNSANQERVMCITTTTDGLLIAWGTDHGKICLISSVTADQLAVWKAHNGPVMNISFSPDSKKLLSVGEDIHEPFIDDEQAAAAIDPKKIPRKHSVFCWNLEDWVKQRMKHRTVKKSVDDE